MKFKVGDKVKINKNADMWECNRGGDPRCKNCNLYNGKTYVVTKIYEGRYFVKGPPLNCDMYSLVGASWITGIFIPAYEWEDL